MIKKISKLFNRNINNKKLNLTIEEEVVILREENQKLKKDLSSKILDKFKTRRSIRKFSGEKIDWKIIYEILEGAINAPCAGNIQNYKIILVEKEEKRKEIGKIAFQQFWLSDAPVLLIIVRDDFHLREMYPNEGKIYSIQNTAALIENILMLTHSYNLGACWVEAYDNEVLKEYLNIPKQNTIDAIIPIGFALENPEVKKDSISEKIFYEKFGNKKRK